MPGSATGLEPLILYNKPMLITLHGPDSYRRLEKLGEIVDAYKKKHTGVSYERVDFTEEGAYERLKNFINTASMFDPVKLVVVDNVVESSPIKDVREFFKANAERENLTIVINSAKKPPAILKFLTSKPAVSQDFAAIKGENIKAFIKQEAKKQGSSLDTRMVSSLAEFFGSDTWGLATEIRQLAFSQREAIESRPNTDYFALVNAVKRSSAVRDRVVALEMIISGRKDEPARVFNSIAYRPSSKEDAGRLADYDVAVKSGKLEYEEVLFGLALGV
jgi:hypothetical protein